MLANRLKQLIDSKGITPYEISVKTGMSQATLSRILSNLTSKPSIRNVEILSKYFNVSTEWLLTGNGEADLSDSTDDIVLIQQRTIENLTETINRQSKIIENLTSK